MKSHKEKVEELKLQFRMFNKLKKAVRFNNPKDEASMYRRFNKQLETTLNKELEK